MGYIIFDTQDIIERAHNGDTDYIKHALTLFTDFIAVLVRILIIMVRFSQFICPLACVSIVVLYNLSHIEKYADVNFSFFGVNIQVKNASDKEEKKKKRRS